MLPLPSLNAPLSMNLNKNNINQSQIVSFLIAQTRQTTNLSIISAPPFGIAVQKAKMFQNFQNFHMGTRTPVSTAEQQCISENDRERYYFDALKPVRVNAGTPYPCRQEDLDSYLKLGYPDKNYVYITPNSATNDLTRWLSQDFDASTAAALKRLQDGFKLQPWGPDLAIKAFEDLDLTFFNGKLSGHVQVGWVKRSKYRRHFGGSSWGVTEKGAHAQCKIFLNAYKIFVDDYATPIPFREMWRTLIHEMVVSLLITLFRHTEHTPHASKKKYVSKKYEDELTRTTQHAYLFVRTGDSRGLRHDPRIGITDHGHGSHFRRCIHMIDRRTSHYLHLNVISSTEDFRRHL